MTAKEYFDNLTWLEQVRPGYVLLPVIREGYTPVNILYLEHALKELATEPDAPVTAHEKVIKGNDPERVKSLHVQKRQLYGERHKLSNSFHDCTTDNERAEVSDQIGRIQDQIEQVQKLLRIWQEKGTLPQEENEDPTEADLLRQINRINQSITYYQQRIRVLANQPNNPNAPGQIEAYESKIRQKKIDRLRARSLQKAIVAR